EHRRAMPADQRCADCRGDVVVARSDVDDQRSQSVERSAVTKFDFLVDLLLDLVQRDMSRTLDHHLHIALPGFLREFAQGLEFCKLRFIAGVGDAAWPQTVAE